MKWLFWPWRKYQQWVIEREYHIAKASNPLVIGRLIWEAILTAAPPILIATILAVCGLTFHLPSLAGDLIAFVALWFGLTRSRDTAVINAISSVCRSAAPNNRYANGYQHVSEMVQKFRGQLRFYNSAIIVVNIVLFAFGVGLSFS